MKEENKYSVPNLERALKIIEYLTTCPEGATLSSVAEKLGYPKNSVFRIQKTLLAHGYLNETDNRYTLSTKFLAIGNKALGENNLVNKSLPLMKELRDETEETVILGKLSGHEGIVLATVLGTHGVKFVIEVGHHFQLYTAAPGKLFIEFSDEKHKEELLDSIEYKVYTKTTIRNSKEMKKELKKVRENGYAVDFGERVESQHCIAAPVFNVRNELIAAVWITAPAFRISSDKFDYYGGIVKKRALKISKLFGYDPDII